jgi:ABC-type branched-subunit amino acid transport system ATPase component
MLPAPSSPAPTLADGLAVEGLTIRYGGLVAVDGVSLQAPLGRITGLIGPNGAGKTTTFNACTGLARPSTGRIRLLGKDVTGLAPQKRAQRGLGRTFQRMELFDSLSVEENVRLGREARLAGVHPSRQLYARRREALVVREAADEALELCGLAHLARLNAGDLSTGQRRLVELARCAAGDFQVMLLDEPSSGLDHDETVRFGEILQALVVARGVGILIVEHDMSLVLSVCAYLHVLDFGQLIFEGTPEEAVSSEIVRAAYLGDDVPVTQS